MNQTMTVRVIDRSRWGTSAPYPLIKEIEISILCSQCGQHRGKPQNHNFHEDGQWLACDIWTNPCGHIDMYEELLAETAEN